MKILFIIPSYQPAICYGGTTVVVSLLAEELAKLNHEVDVYTTTANGKNELPDIKPNETKVLNHVRVTYFKRITGDHTHFSPAMLKTLFKTARQFDIIHLHSWWNLFNISAATLLACLSKEYIISAHGMLSTYTLQNQNAKLKQILHSTLGKRLLGKSTMHACTPQEFEEGLKIIPKWKGFTIPNLINLPQKDIGIKPTNKVFSIAFLSRIEQKKGLETFFHVLPKLSFDYQLTIAGDGEVNYVAQLRNKVQSLLVSDKVNWIGWLNEEKFNFLAKADLFILPSHNENFAVVVLEAIAAGTPVLISNKVGLSYFVAQHQLGWIYDGTEIDLMQKLQIAYEDTTVKINTKENGLNLVSTNFNSVTLAKTYVSQYETLLYSRSMKQEIR